MTSLPPVFRCDPLRLKLTIVSCADNYRVANGCAAPVTASTRGPRAARAARLGPCQGCKTGAVHAETGKARNGLRLEVLRPLIDAPCAPAPAAPAAFDDVRPGAVPEAAKVAAPGAFDGAVTPRPAARPRPDRDEEVPTMRESRPNVPMPKSENLETLRRVVEKLRAELGYPKRVDWPAAIIALACRCVTEDGIRHRVVGEATGIHEVTIYAWVRKAKRMAGDALDAAIDEAPEKSDPEVVVPAPEPDDAGEDVPTDVWGGIGTHKEATETDTGAALGPDLTSTGSTEALPPDVDPSRINTAVESVTPELQELPHDPTKVDPFKSFTASLDRVAAVLARALERASGEPVAAPRDELTPARPVELDDFIELCDRLGMPYRLTDAVLRIVGHHATRDGQLLTEALANLEQVVARKAAA